MWKAFVFGVIVSGTVGPIALLIFGTGARQGLAAGSVAAFGAAFADFLYALAAFLLGALILPFLAGNRFAIDVGCALLLMGFGAWMAVAQLRPGPPPEAPRPAPRPSRRRGQAQLRPIANILLPLRNPSLVAHGDQNE